MSGTILLTGATGFLGSHILKRLLESEVNVVILIRESSNKKRIKNLNGFSTFIVNDQVSNIHKLFEMYAIDTIIHVATEYGRDLPYSSVLESNVLLPIKLIEAGSKKGISLFINTDSFFSKFPNYSYLREYITSKKIITDYLKSISDIKVINLKLEHIYGENDSESKFITSLLNKMFVNESNIKLTEGNQRRDFVYVADVVNAYLFVLEKQYVLDQYTEFEVGTGNSITIKDFVFKMHKIIGSTSNLLFGNLETRINEIQDSKADNLSLCKLGWKAEYTPEKAIKRILNIEKNKNQ